jgi:uncharacterized membrane protein
MACHCFAISRSNAFLRIRYNLAKTSPPYLAMDVDQAWFCLAPSYLSRFGTICLSNLQKGEPTWLSITYRLLNEIPPII